MRPFEVWLLLADVMALLVLSVPRLRGGLLLRHLPAIASVMAAAQWWAEGPRWQMLPAYALTVVLLLLWLHRNFASRGRRPEQKGRHRAVAAAANGLGALGLAVAVALPLVAPVFRFDPPTGPYVIGTLVYHWVDAARSEVFVADPKTRRQLMVQIWYPAQAHSPGLPAAYMPDADAVTTAFARIHDKPAFVFGHFKYVTTHARVSAPSAVDQPRYPVLLFLEGATGFRQMNTFQVEHLVSHGYIVVGLDQPGAAAAVVFPDGHQAAGLSLAQFHATVAPSYMPSGAGASPKGLLLPSGRPMDDHSIVPYLARDAAFALDRLGALNRADPHGVLTGRLDLQRVGVFGVSLGGIVVGEACRTDARFRACLVMDAPMSAAVVKAGLQQPGMWVTRDAASMRLERQRAGGWPDAEIEAHQGSMRAVYEGLSGAGYFVRVPGMFHSNFTDVARWTPLSRVLGLAGPIDDRRAHGIVNAYSLAFFDRHLLGRPAPLLDGPAKQYPEVLFESHGP